MPSNCNGVSRFQQISEKTKNLPLKFGYFHFSVSFSTFLTTFWQPIFLSIEPSRTVLSIDRSEPRFESHAGGEIRKILKNGGNFDGSC